MKKKLALFVLIIFGTSTGILLGQSITVTKPAAGEKWTKTKAYEVTWTKTGTMPSSVKIDLYDKNGTAVVKPIIASASNNGSFPWTVPADSAVGDYRIRVKANGANVQDDSEVFHIASALTPGDVGAATTKVQEKPPFNAAVAQAAENIKYVPAQCTNWMQTLPIQAPKEYSQARPKPCHNMQVNKYAAVGYDHFSYSGTNSYGDPFTNWIADVYRSKVYFFIEDIKNNVPLRDRLIEAKMKFKQVESIRANTNHASCATGMGVLHAMWTDWWNPPIAHMVGLSFGSTEYLVDVTETVRNWLTGGEVNYGFFLNSEKEDVIQENITCFSCYEITLVLKFSED